ncbi:hypothetical protein DE146DRAFT_433642 [Phaeosphaeria sp. MPI-PUGE-AT-0046c]|nr:hypothetical protein DE146DRAFT_433642 [Phaeosphaeria sp. MPI-PUGE-AT-0046c]
MHTISIETNCRKGVHSQDAAAAILVEVKNVERHMHRLRRYFKAQEADNKPLYQWAPYEGYPALNASVSKLKKAMTKFKYPRLPQEYFSKSVARASNLSTSVSTSSVDILAAINKKTADYMDEMVSSTLSDDAKAQANTVVTEEIRKLLEHSTSATGTVWQATDLLRTCGKKQGDVRSCPWSVGATTMTVFVATVVSLATNYLFDLASLDVLPARSSGHASCSQVVDLVQQARVVTNLTSELCSIKMQDVDHRYNYLAALSEAHGLRIDGIVDGLGPPNQEGTYYVSTSKSDNNSCRSSILKVSEVLQNQLQRQQQELELMRKNMHRMDVRLTRGIEKARKE